MDIFAGGQVAIFFAVLLLTVKPVGAFMAAVYQGERTFLSPLLAPVERLLYRLCRIDPAEEMDWKRYAVAMLLFNAVCFATLFAMLLFQHLLPLNPQNLPAFSWPLALNTAVSFTTNTNWQNYSGEQAASYFTQMLGFTVHNFLSAASGMAVAVALIRGFVRRKTAGLGNFWADLTRGTLYILLPLSLVAALILVSQGVIQNFSASRTAPLVQATSYDQPQLDDQGQRRPGRRRQAGHRDHSGQGGPDPPGAGRLAGGDQGDSAPTAAASSTPIPRTPTRTRRRSRTSSRSS